MRLRLAILSATIALMSLGMWWSADLKSIAAGLALFLLGMLSLNEGFKTFTGGALEDLLRRGTDRIWKSILLGAVSTTIMQSSSLVSLITISFLSAGLIDLAGGIGVVFGANLGSTSGAWIVAAIGLKVDVSAYAMPMLTFGVLLLFQQGKVLRGIGNGLLGLGLLFLGIHYMKLGFETFSQAIDLSQLAIEGAVGLLVYGLIGTLATVVLQSSHASMLLIITALSVGQITYENAMALAIGANLGTTVTAILGSLGASIDGKRLAVAHFLFNGVTGVLAIAFLPELGRVVDTIASWWGIADDSYTLKLAIFHTLFNTLGILVMTPFIPLLVRLLTRILVAPSVDRARPKYLSDAALEFPEAAVRAIRLELERLYDNAFRLIAHSLGLQRRTIRSDAPLMEEIAATRKAPDVDIDEYYAQQLKPLDGAILDFTVRALRLNLNEFQARDLASLRGAGRNIVEAVKGAKHLQKNLRQRMLSRNPAERACYEAIRLQLATLLREIEELRQQPDGETDPVTLDALQLELREFARARDDEIENLIYNQRISAEQATSLMNDLNYAVHIGTRLIHAARALVHDLSGSEMEAVNQVTLTEEELDALELPASSAVSDIDEVAHEKA